MAIAYLHIGTHKTGTTTLQRFLFENREKLQEYNLAYPEIGLHPGLKGHHPVAFYLAGKRFIFRKVLPQVNFRDVISNFLQLLGDGNNLIISSEDFSRLSLSSCPNLPSKVKGLFPLSTEFRIVVYLRRQDQFIESYYSWQRKGGRMLRTRLDGKFLKRIKYFPYSELLNRWAQVFGEENISVRPFEKQSLYSGGLVQDFLHEVGVLEWAGLEVEPPRLNMAYTPRQLEALDYLRDAISGPQSLITKFSRNFIAKFSDVLELRKGAKRSITPDLASEFLEHFLQDNNLIAKRYLGRNRLFLNDSLSKDGETHVPLGISDYKEIDRLLPYEIARFNTGGSENGAFHHLGRSKILKIRRAIHRRTLKIGAFTVGSGRILRIFNMFLAERGIVR